MERSQKEKLRFFLKARKRADKVLASQREVERKKQEHARRVQASQELKNQYNQELVALAQESGILSMAERAALQRGGSLAQELSCYVDYGLSNSCLQRAAGVGNQGELRAAHLALKVTWEEAGALKEVEIRMHKNGQITFHNNILPIFPFLWRRNPQILEKMLESALLHPVSR